MKRQLIIWLLLLLLASTAFAQTGISKNKFVGKTFWTKFVFATVSDCTIEITPDDLSPSAKSCNFYDHLTPGTAIKLKSLKDAKDWARLTFEVDGDEFEIFVKNDTKTNFRKSFDLAFSTKKAAEDEIFANCNLENKNKIDVIRQMGFPSEIKRTGTTEIWVFGIGWSGGSPCGFEITDIQIKDNKVSNIGGII